MTLINFQSWLDHLRCLLPVTGVLHIGTANAAAERPLYADWGVSHVLRLEAEQTQPGKLADELESLVSGTAAQAQFVNWALIDCLPALPVLQRAEKLFDALDVIIIRHGDDSGRFEADDLLAASGYLGVAMQQDDAQPGFGQALYVRQWQTLFQKRLAKLQQDTLQKSADHAESIAGLQEALKKQAVQATENHRRIEELNRVRDEQIHLINDQQKHIEQMTQALEEQTGIASERQRQVEQLARAREGQSRRVAELQQQVEQLSQANQEQAGRLEGEKQLADFTQQVARVAELIKAQQAQFEKMDKGTKNQLAKGLENSMKQIESFVAIQTYLTHDKLIPPMHGWPVSADFALYLISLIEQNDYDLILEFGSGTSTLLMATAILRKQQRHTAEQSPSIAGTSPETAAPSHKLVTFDHDRKYFEETLARLHQAGLGDIVDLNHAPLQPYITSDGEQFLYYSCEETIRSLAQHLEGRNANILVVVDGPPGSTGKNARYPALPIILEHLSAHRLDVLLDDFNRQDEHEIVELWSQLITKQSLAHETRILAFEKGACLISINT